MITPPNMLKLMARGLPGMAGRGAKRAGGAYKKLVNENPVAGFGAAAAGGGALGLGLSAAMGGGGSQQPSVEELLEYVTSSGGWNDKTKGTLYGMAMSGQLDPQTFQQLLGLLDNQS